MQVQMLWMAAILILAIIIICLIYKLNKKQSINRDGLRKLQAEIKTNEDRLQSICYETNQLVKEKATLTEQIEQYNNKILEVQKKYREELNRKTSDLDTYFINQKQLRQSELDTTFDQLWREKQQNLEFKYKQLLQEYQDKKDHAQEEMEQTIAAATASQTAIIAETQEQQKRFEGLLLPLQQYEKEQQERLFYTIQVPDEYKEDINFLVTTVSQKVQHPDIINKLVWAEYVKPYIDETFKRVGIEEKPGIYKITNIDSGKCYIGKSTNIKKRIIDHFKSSIGIKTISDQAVHHAIWQTGFWNWAIEPIIYCEKEQLSDLEKYYIDFFKSNTFGFNKTGGGEG